VCVKEASSFWNTAKSYTPVIGFDLTKATIAECQSILDGAVQADENKRKADIALAKEEEQKAEEAAKVAEEETKRQQDITDLADKRTYEEKQTAEQRTYNEGQEAEQRAYNEQTKEEQRNYNEQQAALEAQRQAGLEATATESSGSSTLTFGLLNTGGDTQFVDRDKAAQYYFEKPYEDLTPAQKKLLMLSKGE